MKTKSRTTLRLVPLDSLAEAAECLRLLAHPTRLRIVDMLLQGRFTVGELAEACEIQSHMASEHLRIMKHCGLLRSERDGRRIFYAIAETHLEGIMDCVRARFGRNK